MQRKPLLETNSHLRDPEKFRKALLTSVASSTAIETGASVTSIVRMLEREVDSPVTKQHSFDEAAVKALS